MGVRAQLADPAPISRRGVASLRLAAPGAIVMRSRTLLRTASNKRQVLHVAFWRKCDTSACWCRPPRAR